MIRLFEVLIIFGIVLFLPSVHHTIISVLSLCMWRDRAFRDACRNGDVDQARALWPMSEFPRESFKFIASEPWNDPRECEYFQNALHAACEDGHVDIVKFLVLEKHMPIGKTDSFGRTPLKIACEGGHTECASLVIGGNDDLQKMADRHGQTPFHAACCSGADDELIQLLYRRGVELSTPASMWHQSSNGHWCKLMITPVAGAVLSESTSVVGRLLAWGIDSQSPTRCQTCVGPCSGEMDGLAPLQIANLQGLGDIIPLLTEKKKRRLRKTPMKTRAENVGVVLAPTPAGLRDAVESSSPATRSKARHGLQRHHKSCEQKVARAELMQSSDESAKERFISKRRLAVQRSSAKNKAKYAQNRKVRQQSASQVVVSPLVHAPSVAPAPSSPLSAAPMFRTPLPPSHKPPPPPSPGAHRGVYKEQRRKAQTLLDM